MTHKEIIELLSDDIRIANGYEFPSEHYAERKYGRIKDICRAISEFARDDYSYEVDEAKRQFRIMFEIASYRVQKVMLAELEEWAKSYKESTNPHIKEMYKRHFKPLIEDMTDTIRFWEASRKGEQP